MNIQSIPNYSLYFRGNKVENKEELTKHAKLALGAMHKRCEEEVPENGPVRPPVKHIYDIPNTANQAMFLIKKPSTAASDKRVLIIGAERRPDKIDDGKDLGATQYVLKLGTKKEILDELKKLEPEEVAKDIKKLSDNVDERYSQE